jgi:hypothetical protein
LTHKTGHIDDYLNEFMRLMYLMGWVTNDTLMGYLLDGLDERLGDRWSELDNRPTTITGAIKKLREMGHSSEDRARKKKARRLDGQDKPTSSESKGTEKSQPGKKKSRKSGKEKSAGRDESPSDQPKRIKEKPWKDAKVELEGVSPELRKKRHAAERCQKCGKEGHKWWNCSASKPVTEDLKVAATKRQRDDSEEAPSPKRVAGARVDFHLMESPGYIVGEVDSDQDTPMFSADL